MHIPETTPDGTLLRAKEAAAQQTLLDGSLEPTTSFESVLPAHARVLPGGPLQLENTGLTSQKSQTEFWQLQHLWKEAVASKLFNTGNWDLAEAVAKCHTEQSFAQCGGCHAVRTFWNRCDLFYCPICQPRLAVERRKSVEWWTKQIKQPKHVVLTQRNTTELSFDQVKQFKANLARLRRTKFASGWKGGMWSLEVTNEGRGWHLHAHLLVDCRWIDGSELAMRWGKVIGDETAIVKVKDCRQADYLKEVTKYAVKGSALAGWEAGDVLQFVLAFKGQRTFGVFGSLYGKRTQWSEWLKSLAEHGKKCACGCETWKIYTETEWEWKELSKSPVLASRPPPEQSPQGSLTLA